MGRDIRRVPKGWEHPKAQQPWGYDYQPLFDESFEEAAREWLDKAIAWDKNEDLDCNSHHWKNPLVTNKEKHPFYWTWAGNPPNEKYYRPSWTPEEATCYQIYENVSEGTPVSPVFETKEDLIEWLVKDGGEDGRVSRKVAEEFVKHEYAPSITFGPGGSKMGIHSYEDD